MEELRFKCRQPGSGIYTLTTMLKISKHTTGCAVSKKRLPWAIQAFSLNTTSHTAPPWMNGAELPI